MLRKEITNEFLKSYNISEQIKFFIIKSNSPRDEIIYNSNLISFNNLLSDRFLDSLSIENNLFRDFSHLTEINLSKNKIKTLHSRLFQDLNNLVRLDLSFNQLQSIDTRLFKGLTSLTYIFLNNNQLTSMNSKLFKGLENLTHIWLNDNEWISNNLELYIEGNLEFISFKRGYNDNDIDFVTILVS